MYIHTRTFFVIYFLQYILLVMLRDLEASDVTLGSAVVGLWGYLWTIEAELAEAARPAAKSSEADRCLDFMRIVSACDFLPS